MMDNKCGICGKVVPIDHEQIARVAQDGTSTVYHMACERAAMKIIVLNSLEVIDWSSAFGELEYVLTKNVDETRSKLLEAGFTLEQILEACDDDLEEIDLSHLAFNYTEAKCWSLRNGFSVGQGGTGDE